MGPGLNPGPRQEKEIEMSREEMESKICHKYGMENELTIIFCEICENAKVKMNFIREIFDIIYR